MTDLRCACHSRDSKACIRSRYPQHFLSEDPDPLDEMERCECVCHYDFTAGDEYLDDNADEDAP